MARIDRIVSPVSHKVLTTRADGSTSTQDDLRSITSMYRDRSDITRVVPDASGFRKPTAYRCVVNESDNGFCTYRKVRTSPKTIVEGSGSCVPAQAGTVDLTKINQQLKQSVLIKALSNLDSQKWAAGVAIAEMRESVDLIGSGARRLARAGAALARKDHRALARALGVKPKSPGNNPKYKGRDGRRRFDADIQKSSSNMWLEYHFGWAPIVSDIADAAVALSSEDVHNKVRLVARSRALLMEGVNLKHSNATPLGAISLDLISHVRTRYEYRVSLWYAMGNSTLKELERFGVANIPAILWESTPFSFVADWVIGIGDVLAAWTADLGLTFIGGSATSYGQAITNTEVTPRSGGSGYTIEFFNAYYPAVSRTSMVRDVFKTSPKPVIPVINNPFSTWRTVTSIALLKQVKTP